MADESISVKPCIKCGSIDRNSNGDCRPCQIACSAAWKANNKARITASGEPLFYTYIHLRADDGKVFYVGKGKGGRATTEKNRNQHWQRTVKKHGIRVEIIARWASETEAFDHEKLLIAQYRAEKCPLCNHTDGGDGPSGFRHSEETRAKLSKMQIGKKLSVEHRAKLSLIARKGIPRTAEVREKISRANKGRKHTEEHRRKNSEVHRGLKRSAEAIAKHSSKMKGHLVSAETRAKISAAHTGMKYPAEFGAKISAANKGRVRSPEFKAKVSAGLTGRPVSTETRNKMSASLKGRKVSQEMRDRISKTLTGITHSVERRAAQSAGQIGRAHPRRKVNIEEHS